MALGTVFELVESNNDADLFGTVIATITLLVLVAVILVALDIVGVLGLDRLWS